MWCCVLVQRKVNPQLRLVLMEGVDDKGVPLCGRRRHEVLACVLISDAGVTKGDLRSKCFRPLVRLGICRCAHSVASSMWIEEKGGP